MTHISFSALTHPNQATGRHANEDAFLICSGVRQGAQAISGKVSTDQPRLFAVSDGLHVSPQASRASRLLLEALEELFRETPDQPARMKLLHLHDQYCAHAIRRPQWAGMAATLVAAEVRGNHVLIYYVGDSPAWTIRGNHARRLTRDHTILNAMIEGGEVASSQAGRLATIYDGLDRYFAAFPGEIRPEHEECNVDMADGDILLLASDGLSVLSGDQIASSVSDDLDAMARNLLGAAVEKGSDDDITLILLRFSFESDPSIRNEAIAKTRLRSTVVHTATTSEATSQG